MARCAARADYAARATRHVARACAAMPFLPPRLMPRCRLLLLRLFYDYATPHDFAGDSHVLQIALFLHYMLICHYYFSLRYIAYDDC